MEPLSDEEKAEYSLDESTDYFWDKRKNIRDAKGLMVKRLDMDSETAKRISSFQGKRKMRDAQDQVKELIEQESAFTFDEAPYALVLAAERAITGSSADMRLFLEQARGVGKLADKSKDAAPQKIIVEMDKDVREAWIRGVEIIQQSQQRRATGADAPDRPF